MKSDLFKIGPITVHGYGLMIAIGIIVAYIVAEYRVKKRDENPDTAFNLAVCALISGVIGAKLLYYIVEIKSIIQDPSLLLDIANGFVVYGGIIAGVAACYIYCRIKKIDWLKWFDLIIPEIALAQGFGRIGCLLAGCCYGVETKSAIHIVFTDSPIAPNHVQLVPTQIISSLANFMSFFALVFIIPRIFKKRGCVTAFFLIFYSAGRFIIEFFRGDLERGAVGVLSTSQFISIFVFIGAIALLAVVLKMKPKPEAAVDKEPEITE